MGRRPRWLLAAIAVTLLTGLGVASAARLDGWGRDPVTTADRRTPAPTAPPENGPPERLTVPDVSGMSPRAARAALGDAGLDMLVHRIAGRTCDVDPRIVDQAGGRRLVQVWVRVDSLTCGLTPELQDTARRFIAFARGHAGHLDAAAPVELFVSGRVATTIASARVNDPRAWRGCPKGWPAAAP